MTFWTSGMMGAAAGGALPYFVSASGAATSHASNDLIVDKPAGAQDGDILLMFASGGSGGTSVSTPSGWSQVLSGDSNSPIRLVFMRVVDGDGASYTTSGANSRSISILCFRRATVVDASSEQRTTSTSVATAPSVSASANGMLVCCFMKLTNDASVVSHPSGMDAIYARNSDGVFLSSAFYSQIVGPGSTGDRTATFDTANASCAGIQVVIT